MENALGRVLLISVDVSRMQVVFIVQRGFIGGKLGLVEKDVARKVNVATLEVLESTGMHCPGG